MLAVEDRLEAMNVLLRALPDGAAPAMPEEESHRLELGAKRLRLAGRGERRQQQHRHCIRPRIRPNRVNCSAW
jgi:hypothetical protein